LDHFLRRNENETFVVGILQGHRRSDGIVEVTNSFAVPYTEQESRLALDEKYFASMVELFSRVSRKEAVLGWYQAGKSLLPVSGETDELLLASCGPAPICLCMDPTLSTDSSITLYSRNVGPQAVDTHATFEETYSLIHHSAQFPAASLPGLGAISQAMDKPRDTPLLTDLDALEQALLQIRAQLDRVAAHVEGVLDGSIVGDAVVGRALLALLTSTSTSQAEPLEKLFNGHLQDLLLVNYLANLTRAQIVIADRLQAIHV